MEVILLHVGGSYNQGHYLTIDIESYMYIYFIFAVTIETRYRALDYSKTQRLTVAQKVAIVTS